MACTDDVLGGKSPSSIMVPVDKNENRELCHGVPLQCPNPMLKDDDDNEETWGHHRAPLRPPFTVLRPGSYIPGGRRPLRQPFTLTPAVEEELLATAEINISEGLDSQSQKKHYSINMSQEVSSSPTLPEMVSGPKVNCGPSERACNNSHPYVAFPGGQGFFPPRGPQQSPAYLPNLRSGVMMEVTSRNVRMANSVNLARVSFPVGAPRHFVDNWQRLPLPFTTNTPRLACSGARGFIPSQLPRFNVFPNMPIVFNCPLTFTHPLLPFFFFYNSGAMRFPPHSN
uniref:Proline rich 32 n=1 Tax=Jaculus jaculus TaxID=51337 RepID=A0A8C5KT67_JACJA|nr:proline-rich protein 32 [Jaculus jaculus]